MAAPKTESKALRWTLIGILVAFVVIADWFAGGVGPRVLLGSATLNLTSQPDAARVLLDGEAVGRTPLLNQRVRPGRTVVRMEHRFHDAVARAVSPARGEAVDVHVEFPVATGSLEIVTNPRGADVTVDGKKLEGVTPIMLSPHPTGSFEVAASIHGREAKIETVEVLPRQNTEASFELERVPMSEIHIARSPRDLELEIDGKPYKPGMTLPIGAYRLRAQRPGYAPLEKTVEFSRGRNDQSVSLVRLQGSLSLAVSPPDAKVEVSYPHAGDWRTVRYRKGMAIPTGPVTVRAKAVGHRSYERRLTVEAKRLSHAIRLTKYDVEPGRRLRDGLASGGEGPLLVVIGTGTFRMGSDEGSPDERPVREVEVAQPFAIGVFETTRSEFERFRVTTGEAAKVSSRSPGPEDDLSPEARSRLPETGVSWQDAQDYVGWLSAETGNRYRLPSEAEWEYVARGGTTAPYYFGDDVGALCGHANVADAAFEEIYPKPGVASCSDGAVRRAVVGGFPANGFGVHDMLGNVEEWVADCWHGNYRGAPSEQGARSGNCGDRVVRGGAWDSTPAEATVSYRSFSNRGSGTRGIRVVRDL